MCVNLNRCNSGSRKVQESAEKTRFSIINQSRS